MSGWNSINRLSNDDIVKLEKLIKDEICTTRSLGLTMGKEYLTVLYPTGINSSTMEKAIVKGLIELGYIGEVTYNTSMLLMKLATVAIKKIVVGESIPEIIVYDR